MEKIKNNFRLYDVIMVGGGLSALSLSIFLYDTGVKSLCIIERESEPGGSLKYGLGKSPDKFGGQSLNEYIESLVCKVRKRNIKIYVETEALRITKNHCVVCSSLSSPSLRFYAKSIVVCTGAREISRGELGIPGSRPSGIISAGALQKMIFKNNIDLGREIAIIGSNNLALTLCKILAGKDDTNIFVIEKNGKLSAKDEDMCDFPRDKVKIFLNTNCTQISGYDRIESISIESKDENGSSRTDKLECDNIVISCGFTPDMKLVENSNSVFPDEAAKLTVNEDFMTQTRGIFAIGDSVFVHDDLQDIINEARKVSSVITQWLSHRTPALFERLKKVSRIDFRIKLEIGKILKKIFRKPKI